MIDILNSKFTDELQLGSYHVEKFDSFNNHYIGIDKDNNIALLINNINSQNLTLTSYKGENLEILFDQETDIINATSNISTRFTILRLLNKTKNTQYYFCKICEILLTILGDEPDIKSVEKEVFILKDIFKNLTNKLLKDEIGLWGELLVISIQNNIGSAVNAWHISNTNRIDFNDGKVKVEIKTTTLNERKHVFKLNQLKSHFRENVIVGSVVTEQIDNGVSIKDLINKIEGNINSQVKILFNKKLAECLGSDIFGVEFKNFDYNFAIENFLLFYAQSIPSIESEIPDEVSDIQFSSLLKENNCIQNIDIFQIFD